MALERQNRDTRFSKEEAGRRLANHLNEALLGKPKKPERYTLYPCHGHLRGENARAESPNIDEGHTYVIYDNKEEKYLESLPLENFEKSFGRNYRISNSHRSCETCAKAKDKRKK